jgi:beta-lactam-binding protein with PASTA domain
MKLRLRAINRFFNILLGALAMLVVALTSAFISMRLAIHGREAKVPNLTGLTLEDASKDARALGLRLTLEDRFYANNTPAGLVLAQSPAPGTTVRRQWAVRVTESLGPQQVSIPNLIGQSERTASINLRRLALNVGTIAYIQSPNDPGIVLAQTPNPNASGVDRPRVSLLLSQPEVPQTIQAFVMPSLTGLPLMSAAARASAAGLRIVSAEEIKQPTPVSTTPSPATASPVASTPVPPVAASVAPIAGTSTATVVAQTPPAGYRVVKGDPVQLSIAY